MIYFNANVYIRLLHEFKVSLVLCLIRFLSYFLSIVDFYTSPKTLLLPEQNKPKMAEDGIDLYADVGEDFGQVRGSVN